MVLHIHLVYWYVYIGQGFYNKRHRCIKTTSLNYVAKENLLIQESVFALCNSAWCQTSQHWMRYCRRHSEMHSLKGTFSISIQISLKVVKSPSGKGLAQCNKHPTNRFQYLTTWDFLQDHLRCRSCVSCLSCVQVCHVDVKYHFQQIEWKFPWRYDWFSYKFLILYFSEFSLTGHKCHTGRYLRQKVNLPTTKKSTGCRPPDRSRTFFV